LQAANPLHKQCPRRNTKYVVSSEIKEGGMANRWASIFSKLLTFSRQTVTDASRRQAAETPPRASEAESASAQDDQHFTTPVRAHLFTEHTCQQASCACASLSSKVVKLFVSSEVFSPLHIDEVRASE
jgi:hypothetical protein